MYCLLQKNARFDWSPEAFLHVKQLLSSPPVLRSPTTVDNLVLETDASNIGAGSCLKGLPSDGKPFIIAYNSYKFSSSEQNWNIVEKEAYAILHACRTYRHYLLGTKFLIKCDSQIVTYMQSKHQPKSRKMLNWALELSEYDFEIEHVPGKENLISDCLSRMLHVATTKNNVSPNNISLAVLSSISDMSIPNLLQLQAEDIDIMNCVDYLNQNRKNYDVTKLNSYRHQRKHLHVLPNRLLAWKNRVVVPISFRPNILALCHDHPTAGHFAVERTYSRFKDSFYWPNAYDDVVNWISSCEKCQQFNAPKPGYVKAPLQPIKTTERFQLVCYDLAGPFTPITPRGNQYVLIVVDHFSHWPEFIPLRDTTAPTLAHALFDQWCCRYGTPDRFHSDGANNVHGYVMKELSNLLGIDKTKSSRLHPQGDGLAESFVKVLKSCIQKHVDSQGSNWDIYIQAAAFAVQSNTLKFHQQS